MNYSILIYILVSLMALPTFARSLKFRTTVGKVSNKSFPVPGGKEFDFGYAVNAQMVKAVAEHPQFVSLNTMSNIDFSTASANPDLANFSNIMGLSTVLTAAREQEVPACLVDRSYIKLVGQIVSFEITGGLGIKFGFNDSGSHSGFGIGGSYNVDNAKLFMNLYAVDTYSSVVTSARALASRTENWKSQSGGVNVSFNKFSVGPQFYMQSPFAKMADSAAKNALSDLFTNLSGAQAQSEYPWHTTVVAAGDPTHLINVGRIDGVKSGDRFKINNMVHAWSGEPCHSTYLGREVAYAATVEVISIGDYASEVRVLDEVRPIKVGDKVVIDRLVP